MQSYDQNSMGASQNSYLENNEEVSNQQSQSNSQPQSEPQNPNTDAQIVDPFEGLDSTPPSGGQPSSTQENSTFQGGATSGTESQFLDNNPNQTQNPQFSSYLSPEGTQLAPAQPTDNFSASQVSSPVQEPVSSQPQVYQPSPSLQESQSQSPKIQEPQFEEQSSSATQPYSQGGENLQNLSPQPGNIDSLGEEASRLEGELLPQSGESQEPTIEPNQQPQQPESIQPQEPSNSPQMATPEPTPQTTSLENFPQQIQSPQEPQSFQTSTLQPQPPQPQSPQPQPPQPQSPLSQAPDLINFENPPQSQDSDFNQPPANP